MIYLLLSGEREDTVAKGWQVPGADFAEAVGEETYDISTQYGVDINTGLEGCLSLTVKNTPSRRRSLLMSTKSVSDLKARMFRYKVNMPSFRFSRIVMASDDDVLPRFTIDSETDRQYSHFNARGTELTVRLLPPAIEDNQDSITNFKTSLNDLFDYALRNVDDSDMVGVTIHNEVNLLDKAISISFRRKDQLSEEVICLCSVR